MRDLYARVELEGFKWWKPTQPPETTFTGRGGERRRALILPNAMRREYLPNRRDVGAYLVKERLSESRLRDLVRLYGPLTEPDVNGYLDIEEELREADRLQAVAKAWQDALLVAHSSDFDVLDSATSNAVRKPQPASEFIRRRDYAAPAFTEWAAARAKHVALAVEQRDDESLGLVIRPANLAGLLWLSIARGILRGELTSKCRREGCNNFVDRVLEDGNSMQRQYCSESCKKAVKHHPKLDRWPQLHGRSKAEQAKILRDILLGEQP